MRLIVGVKSCIRDMEAGFHDAIRATWGADLKARGIPTYFFMGGQGLKEDEIYVDAPDDYMNLPLKTKGIAKFAAATTDRIFLCDNDTIVNAERFMDAAQNRADYAGFFNRSDMIQRFDYRDRYDVYMRLHPWCSGGLGYFLSREACLLVSKTPPQVWAEDMYVGQVIGDSGLTKAHLDLRDDTTWHYRKSVKYPKFTPELLYRMHRNGPHSFYQEAFS